MNIRFISDLHLGHKNILKFSPERGGTDVESHSEWLVEQWNSVVQKRDLVWVLGDVVFDKDHFKYLKRMYGNKHLILGNHDEFSIAEYSKYFNRIHGFQKYKGFWLSHAPVHPNQLRKHLNIHGHVHHNDIKINKLFRKVKDSRYINVSVEAVNGVPLSLEDIRKGLK